MTRKILFIDDLRNPDLQAIMVSGVDEILVARNSQEAIETLQRENESGTVFSTVYWDHDLGVVNGSVDETRPVVKWLEQQAVDGNTVNIELNVVHTSNPVAAEWLVGSLSSYPLYYAVQRVHAGLISMAD